MCTTLIKTRTTHCSVKSSHNGLKAAVEGGGEGQVADIRPSRSHVSNLFPIDASASDVTIYEGGFSTGVLSIPFFHLYAAAGKAAAGTIFCYLSTTLSPVFVRRCLWHFPPALSAFVYAVLGLGMSRCNGSIRRPEKSGRARYWYLRFSYSAFTFFVSSHRHLPHFFFPYHFYSYFCASY